MLGSSQPARHANSVQPKQYKDKIVSKIVYTLTETQLAASSVGRKSIHGRIITRSQHTDKYGFWRDIVSGDTVNVYIPWYALKSDVNISNKPSVINIQPLMEVQMLHIQYGN